MGSRDCWRTRSSNGCKEIIWLLDDLEFSFLWYFRTIGSCVKVVYSALVNLVPCIFRLFTAQIHLRLKCHYSGRIIIHGVTRSELTSLLDELKLNLSHTACCMVTLGIN